MKCKIMIIFIFILTLSCSKFYEFDEYYTKGDYLKAYSILKEVDENSKKLYHYQVRYYRTVLKIALTGDKDFLNKLPELITNRYAGKKLEPYINFSKALYLYVNKDDVKSYAEINEIFNDPANLLDEFKYEILKMRGISYYKSKLYNEAEYFLNSYLKYIQDADAYFFLGLTYFYLTNYEKAKINLSLSTNYEYNKMNTIANIFLGDINYSQNKFYNALTNYLDALNMNNDLYEVSFKIGRSFQKMGFNTLSTKFYKITLRNNKDYADAWFYLNIN